MRLEDLPKSVDEMSEQEKSAIVDAHREDVGTRALGPVLVELGKLWTQQGKAGKDEFFTALDDLTIKAREEVGWKVRSRPDEGSPEWGATIVAMFDLQELAGKLENALDAGVTVGELLGSVSKPAGSRQK